jgi:hypothetical protein
MNGEKHIPIDDKIILSEKLILRLQKRVRDIALSDIELNDFIMNIIKNNIEQIRALNEAIEYDIEFDHIIRNDFKNKR